ncbi:hypothetical protein V6N13_108150 [Hibiscus sabdariffa]
MAATKHQIAAGSHYDASEKQQREAAAERPLHTLPGPAAACFAPKGSLDLQEDYEKPLSSCNVKYSK